MMDNCQREEGNEEHCVRCWGEEEEEEEEREAMGGCDRDALPYWYHSTYPHLPASNPSSHSSTTVPRHSSSTALLPHKYYHQ